MRQRKHRRTAADKLDNAARIEAIVVAIVEGHPISGNDALKVMSLGLATPGLHGYNLTRLGRRVYSNWHETHPPTD